MTKRLIDIDDEAEADARAALGTSTYKATVNQSLAKAAKQPPSTTNVDSAFDKLAALHFIDQDRQDAWQR